MSKFQRHFFVCTNERPPGGKPSCSERGARDVLAALEEELARRPSLWGSVAVTPCGCLGPCFDGPTIVVYPDGVWYAGVAVADVAEIAESHMASGAPVERLRYRWPD